MPSELFSTNLETFLSRNIILPTIYINIINIFYYSNKNHSKTHDTSTEKSHSAPNRISAIRAIARVEIGRTVAASERSSGASRRGCASQSSRRRRAGGARIAIDRISVETAPANADAFPLPVAPALPAPPLFRSFRADVRPRCAAERASAGRSMSRND